MPRVSIIIPTYNHRDWIGKTLSSVFEQTCSDYEVIVVNDGSPDDVAEVLRPLRESGRIVYVEQQNAGQAAARNRGLAEARGEFIAFLDDDDLWPADKLQWQLEAFDADRDAEAIAGRAVFVDDHDQPMGHVSAAVPMLSYEMLFAANPIMSPGQVLIRAAALREIGGLDATIWGADDWDLWFKLARRTSIRMRDRIALRYRIHPGNATRQLSRLFLGCRLAIERQLANLDHQKQQQLRRESYLSLCRDWAPRMAQAARRSLARGNVRGAVADVAAMATLLRGTRVVPWMPAYLLAELVPLTLRQWLRRSGQAAPAAAAADAEGIKSPSRSPDFP